MKQIAIILTREIETYLDDYQSTYSSIATGITEWTEVSDEEYNTLIRAQSYDHRRKFVVIERPTDERKFVENTVAAYLKWARKIEEERAVEELKRKEAALQRKLKKEAKTKADRLKLLERLRAEFPDQ